MPTQAEREKIIFKKYIFTSEGIVSDFDGSRMEPIGAVYAEIVKYHF